MKKNHDVGDSSLSETEIMPTLSPPALRDRPAVLVPATARPAAVAFHVLPTEDPSGQQAYCAGLGTLTGPRADPGVAALK